MAARLEGTVLIPALYPVVPYRHPDVRSLESRADAQLLIGLALIHHLAVAKGVPLPLIAECLARLGPELVVEFVPPEDARAAALLRDRLGQSNAYDRATFIEAFARYWTTVEEIPLAESVRSLFVMRRR